MNSPAAAGAAPKYEPFGWHHCNPTLGQEIMIGWLADVFKMDQRKLNYRTGWRRSVRVPVLLFPVCPRSTDD
jgi:hypothetical protein